MTRKVDLTGHRILIAEDNYVLAQDMKQLLQDAGAEVIGPYPSEAQILENLLNSKPTGATLDVELSDTYSYGVAKALADQNIPFIFVTGHNSDNMPSEFSDRIRVLKPMDSNHVLLALDLAISANAAPSRPRRMDVTEGS